MNIRHLVLPLAILAAGCGSAEKKEITSAPLGTYAVEEIKPIADKLLQEIKLGDSVRADVLERLDEMMENPELKPQFASPGCSGVGVFQFGSGGLVLSGGAGSGLMSFADGSQSVPFDTQAFAIGLTAGGQNTYGVILVMGLGHEENLSGDYSFMGHGGTIGETSYRVGNAVPDEGTHELHFCGSGIGVGGSAATATGEIILKPDAKLVEASEGGDHHHHGEGGDHDHKDGKDHGHEHESKPDHDHKDGKDHGHEHKDGDGK